MPVLNNNFNKFQYKIYQQPTNALKFYNVLLFISSPTCCGRNTLV